MVPGVMIHPRFGKIDFRRDDLDVDMLKQVVEGGSYYLELTTEGQKELYGIELSEDIQVSSVPEISPKRKILRALS